MAGNNNSGRNRLDDPRYHKSVRIRLSTLAQIAELAELHDVSESKIIQEAVESYVGSFYQLTASKKNLR